MENDIPDLYLGLQEIRSCLVILQKAVQNEGEKDEIEYSDISNYLEVAIGKAEHVIKLLEKTFN